MIDAQRYSRRTYGNNASAAYTALADNLTLSSISMHYSTHADNIAVTHSIIDFQYIFLLLISGAVSSLLRLRTAYSQLRKCAYSNIIPVGSCSVVSQRSGRDRSRRWILCQMLKLSHDRGKMSIGIGWGVPLCRSKNIDPSRKRPFIYRSNTPNSRDKWVSGALWVGGR